MERPLVSSLENTTSCPSHGSSVSCGWSHTQTNVPVDVALAGTRVEMEAIERSQRRNILGITVPIPPPEHITVMKALARRPRDIADIEGLLDRHPDMDLEQVREMLGELAEILEDPTLLEDFDGLVQRWRDSHS